MKIFLFVALCFSVSAQAKLTFTVEKIENGKSVSLVTTQSNKWSWTVKEGNVRVLAIVASFKSPGFTEYQKATSLTRAARVVLKGDQLLVGLQGLTEKLTLSGPQGEITLQITGKFEENSPVVDENCREARLILRTSQRFVPFYVGTSCRKESDHYTFALSFPREAEFTGSTLFEAKGKGEPWRYYELGKIQVASGILGKFTLVYQGTTYEFALESLISNPIKTKETVTKSKIALGAGYSMLGISGSDINASDSEPMLTLKVPHYTITGNLGAMLNIDFALPLKSGGSALTYRQFELEASYELPLGETFKFYPKVGYVIFSENNDSTGIGLDVSNFAFGLLTNINLGKDFSLDVDGMMCSLGSKVLSSHYSISLTVLKKSGKIGWGLGARIQSFKAAGQLGITRNYSQNLFYALISF